MTRDPRNTAADPIPMTETEWQIVLVCHDGSLENWSSACGPDECSAFGDLEHERSLRPDLAKIMRLVRVSISRTILHG